MTIRRPTPRRGAARRLAAVALASALTIGLAACSDDAATDSGAAAAVPEGALTIYSGRNEALVGPLLDKLGTALDVELDVRYAGSSELAAQLLEEGDATDADLFFSQDAGALGALAKADRLAPLPAEVTGAVTAGYADAAGRWVATSARARVIAFDPASAPEVETMSSIDQILDENYRGEIGYAPTNASFHSFVTALRVAKGEDGAREWLERFAALDPQAYEGNINVLDAVDAGEVSLGLINHYYWYERVEEVGLDAVSARIRFLGSDDPGALVNVAGVGVLAGSDEEEAAVRAAEFLVSSVAQQYFADETAEYPVVAGITTTRHDLVPLTELTGLTVDLNELDSLEQTLALLDDVGLDLTLTSGPRQPADPPRESPVPPASWRARRHASHPPLVLVAPAVLAAAIALLPIAYLLVRAGETGPGGIADILARERTLRLVLRSLALTAAVTICCVVLGVALAWLTTRTDLPGRRAWSVVAALPLAVPSYVAAYAWISLLPSLAGFWGTLLVLTLCTYPYVYLPVAASLRLTDPALEEVSRSLGRSPLSTFLSVTLRQVRPAVAAGALLVALYSLSDFGTPSLMRYDVFTRVIYSSYRASFDRTTAAVLSLLLVAITVAITVAESRSRGRAEHARLGGGVARPAATVGLGAGMLPALVAVGAVAALALAYPGAVLAYWVSRGRSAGLEWDRLVPAATSTLWLSLLGAAAATVLAVPVGVLAARHVGRGVRAVEHAVYAGHALPGIVIALALVFLGVRWAQPIYQRTPLLLLAYCVLFLPAAVGSVRAAVAQSPRRLEEVARSLGRRPAAVLRDVTLPLAGPGVAAGFALVMLTCMKELPATLLLRPTGVDTLATRLWTETSVGAYAAAAPYAAALVLLAAVPTFLLSRVSSRGPLDPLDETKLVAPRLEPARAVP